MLNVDKFKEMTELNVYRNQLKEKPKLTNLFLELTSKCNERCIHCGSYCGEHNITELTTEHYYSILDQIKQDFDISKLLLCITGGEPLLRKDFFEIMSYANKFGFKWGMTSNGILITPEVARKLKEVGMRTISISIDGLEATHDAFRQTKGAYIKAMNGIKNLIEVGFEHIQVTTVATHRNLIELEPLFKIFDTMYIDSWRVINIEPIGRAKEHPELLLTKDDYRKLAEFIRNKRINGEPVCYGCSHYLGKEYEHEIRDWYFLCTAGLLTASITSTGDIVACLDIERRPELVQGNILTDRFSDVWYNKFKIFRDTTRDKCNKCKNCSEVDRCHGDSFHTWNFDKNEPNICFKDILF